MTGSQSAVVRPALRYLDVEIDLARGIVRRSGEEQRLRQKTFQVLAYLVENRERLVTREEIFDAVWNGTAVTEDTLVQSIVEIRKALGDDPRTPRFIRTVPKRGYLFIAPTSSAPDAQPTVTLETETTTSFEYELVEETGHAGLRWQFAAGVLSVVVLVSLAVAAVVIASRPPRSNDPVAVAPARTSSDEAFRLYELAVDRANHFRMEEAVALLERAVALDPQFAMAHARIAYALGVRGPDAEKARPHIRRALQLHERLNEKERMIVQGWATIIDGNYEQAVDQFRRIVERYPTDFESHHRLATLLEGEQRIPEAIAVLERARLIDPTRPEIHNALGLYSYVGRHAESIDARRRYVALRPAEPNSYDSLGLSYHAAGEFENALEAYADALRLAPDFVVARYHRAATYVQLGRFGDAVADVEACLAAAADDLARARALSTLSDIHRISGDHAREAEAASRVVDSTHWQPMILAVQRTEAETIDRSVTRLTRFNGRGARANGRSEFHVRAQVALKKGETENALEYLRAAERFVPLLWYVDSLQTGLADGYLSAGRFAEARDEYSRILALTPKRAAALLGRARANEALGEVSAARADYRAFLDLWKNADPDARDRIAAQDRLARLR